MKILDIITAPWAIQPEKLIEIKGIYETHLRGEKIDLKPIEAALGHPFDNSHKGYEIIDGVAVIPVDGVIAKRMNLFTQISGGVSTDLLARDFKAALADPAVEGIVLSIDSPGGTVDGTADIASLVFEARGTKPIVAFTDGMMASAAYWIGSAADKVYIGNDVTSVGSIGVVATHTDISKVEEKAGVKTTEIYAGKYKRIASQYAPLSEAGKAYIQDRVDYIYSVFVNAVASHRGISEKEALVMADGSIFTGTQAVEAGLVDGVSTLSAIIANIRSGGESGFKNTKRETTMANEEKIETTEAPAITAEYLAESHRDIYDAIKALGYDEGKKTGVEEGAKAERGRIESVKGQTMPGHEALIEGLMFDGKTTGEQAAVAVLQAEREMRGARHKGYKEDGSALIPHGEGGGDTAMNRKEFNALTHTEQAAYIREGGKVTD